MSPNAPTIVVEPEAAEILAGALSQAREQDPAVTLQLDVDDRWQHQFSIGESDSHDTLVVAGEIEIAVSERGLARVDGLRIAVDGSSGSNQLVLDNPNAPPAVQQADVQDIRKRLDDGELVHVFDVRPPAELAMASLAEATSLDGAGVELLKTLPKETPIAFLCHHGVRSQQAAEHFRLEGFKDVYNIAGGIDAWSQLVDASVPRY